ncbi:MAG: sensor histidine kinase [Gammaproteobacteria bacterium]|nr:sensor histidine kinase [Gammaproteobacteria bacterium]
MQSIQARLGVGLVSILIILFAIQWFVVSFAIQHLTNEFLHTQLDHESENILSALLVHNNGKVILPESRVSQMYHRPFSGHYYQIHLGENIMRSRSLWDQRLEFGPVSVGEVQTMHVDGPLGHEIVLRVAGYEKHGLVIQIATAHEIADIKQDVVDLQIVYSGISFFALLLLIVLQVVIVSRGFRPAEIVRMQLQAMERGEIGELSDDAPTEIKPLVQEINRLLNLLSQRLDRSRNALGNLAHALKAPLTILGQLTHLPALRTAPNLRQQILNQTEAMRRLVERELKRARLAGAAGMGKRFRPDEDLPPLIEMLETVYRAKDLAIDVEYPEGQSTPLDREDMMELLGNLFDNACKWAKHIVAFYITVDGHYMTATVEDDGPGAPYEQLSKLANRGVRIDESTAGHGLGLSIVQDAVSYYNGELEFGRSTRLGGFWVRVRLPITR